MPRTIAHAILHNFMCAGSSVYAAKQFILTKQLAVYEITGRLFSVNNDVEKVKLKTRFEIISEKKMRKC